jgi:curved DNA-binding protein CbpA
MFRVRALKSINKGGDPLGLLGSKRLFSESSYSGFLFNVRQEEKNLYQILKVKTTATQSEIKLAYYKLAKVHHPDFKVEASEKEKAAAAEEFKKCLKAYEVLSNPIARQAYDLDNELNSGVTLDETTYADSTSNKSYFQPRTQKDFYYTKWTDY